MVAGSKVDIQGLRCRVDADGAELRARGDLAHKVELGIADVQVRKGVDANAVNARPWQRCGGIVAGSAGAELRLQAGAAIPIGIGRARTERGRATGDHIHQLARSVDPPDGAAAGIGEIHVAAGISRDTEDAANTKAGGQAAVADRRLRPYGVLLAGERGENARRTHFVYRVVVLVAGVDDAAR